jgi:hypothetical protein
MADQTQRIGNYNDAAFTFARAHFVKVRWLHRMVDDLRTPKRRRQQGERHRNTNMINATHQLTRATAPSGECFNRGGVLILMTCTLQDCNLRYCVLLWTNLQIKKTAIREPMFEPFCGILRFRRGDPHLVARHARHSCERSRPWFAGKDMITRERAQFRND